MTIDSHNGNPDRFLKMFGVKRISAVPPLSDANKHTWKPHCSDPGCETKPEFEITYPDRDAPDNRFHACRLHLVPMIGTVG